MASKKGQQSAQAAEQSSNGSGSDRLMTVVAVVHHFGKQTGEVVGYYNHCRVRVGQKFRIKASDFSKRWMERLGEHEARIAQEEEADLKADASRGTDLNENVI